MREKEKLKLAICLPDSNMPNISYDKKELLAKLERRNAHQKLFGSKVSDSGFDCNGEQLKRNSPKNSILQRVRLNLQNAIFLFISAFYRHIPLTAPFP